MRSDGKTCAVPRSGSEPAIIASLISEATARQEVTSHETRKRPARTSGRSKSPANKKQKTCTSSAADGDDEDGSRSNSGVGEDGDDQGSDEDGGDSSAGGDDIYGYSGDEGDGGGDGTPPRHSPDEPSDSWICPYCLRYVEITCIKRFETCGRPGFSSRDQLRTHLRRCHSPKGRPQKLENGLDQYYMSTQQWKDVKGVMNSIKRPRKKKNPQKWLEVQKTWYSKVWVIIFPLSQYVPDSPFHTRNKALKERCHQVVKAIMDVECERAQARDRSSREDTQLFTPLQVQEMLDKALQTGLDSLPIAAQHFGRREAVEATQIEPEAGAAATALEEEAAIPTADGSHEVAPNTAAVAAETGESSNPGNMLSSIPNAVTSQPWPLQVAPDAQQTFLQTSSYVLLENNGQSTSVSIELKLRNTIHPAPPHAVARVQVTALSTVSVKIEDPRDLVLDDFNFELEANGAAGET